MFITRDVATKRKATRVVTIFKVGEMEANAAIYCVRVLEVVCWSAPRLEETVFIHYGMEGHVILIGHLIRKGPLLFLVSTSSLISVNSHLVYMQRCAPDLLATYETYALFPTNRAFDSRVIYSH